MKRGIRYLLIGCLAGCGELLLCWVLASPAGMISFVDAAFFAGLFTLLLGGMALFRTLRVKGGGVGNPYNSVAQTTFDSHAALEETRTMAGLSQRVRGGLSDLPLGSVGFLMAAVVVWIGFGIALALG